MKTTIELPDGLVREMKLYAVHEGRKLKDVVADLLRRGLDAAERPTAASPCIVRDEQSGLPLIKCQHPAAPGKEPTPNQIADILLEQEVGWHDEATR